MATLEIKIPDVARTSGSVITKAVLDGVNFAIRLQWNARAGVWQMSIADAEDVAIVSGLTLVPAWDLLGLVTGTRRPAGQIMLWRSDGSFVHPGLADLGTTCKLYYYEAE
jgi:hypothetical protein